MYTAWLIVCCLTTIVWLRRHLDISRALGKEQILTPDCYDSPPDPCPSVSVLVAAKDEEANIERCVRTCLEQDYPRFQITVVNDRSSDTTPVILEKLCHEYPDRLRVLHIQDLPDGWFGKNNAMQVGFASCEGEYLLFTDADCEQLSRKTLSTAVRFAVENEIEFLSVLPVVKPSCLWDALMQPVCSGVLMIWNQPEKVNDPLRPQAYANGAFMLIQRAAYGRIGGHARVRDALCEDMEMARNAKKSGVRLHVVHSRGLYLTRMYDTLDQTFRGWMRIFQGALLRAPKLALAIAVLTVFSIFPFVTLVVSFAGWALSPQDGAAPWGWLFAASCVTCFALQSVMFRFYQMLQAPWARSLLYAPAAVGCLVILFGALLGVLGIGSTTWSGTVYRNRGEHPAAGVAVEEPTTHAG